ncbi:hypothetical protein IVB43_30865 [Bradyrhizobium sp. 48]|uniref:hypothetical protein n=1 Tax=Bradyrhizobium sp. 48 TaxID=2782676 RepID=UPI001FFB6344|nr:hypothetical protein [Bradyrhizobium sp. 48]MCK1446770.1 hypothetical protein [Bradyrhizobium sp. 48]
MVANTTDMHELLRALDTQISEKQAEVTVVLDEIVQLKLRRERVTEALKDVAGIVVAKPKSKRAATRLEAAVPGRAGALIAEALRTAGKFGLTGGELNKVVQDAGLSLAAADKAKARLKQSGTVTLLDGRWRLAVDRKKGAQA